MIALELFIPLDDDASVAIHLAGAQLNTRTIRAAVMHPIVLLHLRVPCPGALPKPLIEAACAVPAQGNPSVSAR